MPAAPSDSQNTMILVTGGAGFIGANFVLDWFAARDEPVVNLDLLTYAGNLGNLAPLADDARHVFVRGDIGDRALVERLLGEHRPRAIVNFAAESHVDRSIHGPAAFVATNVVGTFNLLDVAKAHWAALPDAQKRAFRFLHVSTDEVYGSLGPGDPRSPRRRPTRPTARTRRRRPPPTTWCARITTPTACRRSRPTARTTTARYQFPEKLIPLMIVNALAGKPLPVYGDGLNVRDWLYVDDHCAALRAVLDAGRPGETYNVGGNAEIANLDVVRHAVPACSTALVPAARLRYGSIAFVNDRPGHDRRYAIDASKIGRELGWSPRETFERRLERTVRWYLDHGAWVDAVLSKEYQKWISLNYETAGAAPA